MKISLPQFVFFFCRPVFILFFVTLTFHKRFKFYTVLFVIKNLYNTLNLAKIQEII